ncbi:MAG: NAD(+) synthase, partial [Firmicutes bacterium]|nr:NAD(+) synthase [Bacillota bacterium]
EVRLAAKHYGVPSGIIDRAPSAGLFPGQTDEGEMGVTYEELDQYLLGKKIDAKKSERIEYLHKISAHKRDPLPRPEKFERD